MKAQIDLMASRFPKKVFLVMAILVTLGIAVDSAFNASHVMVFFSLILLSVLFFTLYSEAEKHQLGVSLTCIVLGSLYLIFFRIDFSWWRFSLYTVPLYVSGIVFMASWIMKQHSHGGSGEKSPGSKLTA